MFLSLRGVLPNEYPLVLDVERYIAEERRLGRMLDYAMIVPRLQRLYEWSAEDLDEPRLLGLVRDGNSACNGPSSRSERREVARSSTSRCVNGSPRLRRSRCSAAIGRQSSSTTVLDFRVHVHAVAGSARELYDCAPRGEFRIVEAYVRALRSAQHLVAAALVLSPGGPVVAAPRFEMGGP